jgi:zinc protease
LAAAQPVATARPAIEDRIAPDPAVRYGVLPNGLRYAVMSNDKPVKGLSVRLQVEVGSFDEADNELGAAHFVEHMAFNGTRNFAEDELDRRFAAAGIAFGRDQNAWTSADATQYAADVSLADDAKLDLVFQWLRDTADGQLFEPGAVERERRVVLAEHDRRLGPQLDAVEASERFRSPELRGPTRRPIGTRESLQKLTPAVLTAFYKRWYRPDNAVLVVVGDRPAAELEARIRTTFADWRAEGTLPARAARKAPNLKRGLDVMVRQDTAAPTMAQACFARPATPENPDSIAARRERMPRAMWMAALNERLARLIRTGSAPIISGSVNYATAYEEADYACVTAAPAGEDWRGALDIVMREVKRAQTHGFTEGELKRIVARNRTALAATVPQAVNRNSPGLASTIAADLAEGDVFEHPSESLRIFDLTVGGVTAADVTAAFRKDFSGAGPTLWVLSPQPPTVAAVREAWRQVERAPAPEAYAETATAAFAYTDFGPAGRVAKREVIADPGFVRLTFENGVVVNLKPLPQAVNNVSVLLAFGRGRREISQADLNAARIASAAFVAGGTKRHSTDELNMALGDRRWRMNLGLSAESFTFLGATNADDVKLQLQVMAAYLTEPGFRPEFETAYRSGVELMYRAMDTSPEVRAVQALANTLAPGTPGATPQKASMLALSSRDFARVLSPALAEAPLELTIVGDITEAQAVAAVADTFGALPPRRGVRATRPDAWFFRFPKSWPEIIRTTHKGAKDRAVVLAVWPLYVADPARRREERAINLLGQVMDTRIRRKIREALGQSYAPSVDVDMPDFADQGRLTVAVQTSPADAEAVVREIREVAAELAAGQGLDTAALDAERRAVLDRESGRRQTLGWWINTLSHSSFNDQNLRDQLDWEDTYRSLTPEEVKKAAADWLTGKPAVVVSVPEPVGQRAAAGR